MGRSAGTQMMSDTHIPDFAFRNDLGGESACDVQLFQRHGRTFAVITDTTDQLMVANSLVVIMNKVWTRLRVRPDTIYEHSHDGQPNEQWFLVTMKWRCAIKTYEAPAWRTVTRADVETAIGGAFSLDGSPDTVAVPGPLDSATIQALSAVVNADEFGVEIHLRPAAAVVLIGALQMALRNPLIDEPLRSELVRFINGLGDTLALDVPEVKTLIDRGWPTAPRRHSRQKHRRINTSGKEARSK